MKNNVSFIFAGILSRKFTFFYAPRKNLLRSGKVLKTHATPTPALFMQKNDKKCQETRLKISIYTRELFEPNFLEYLICWKLSNMD